MIMTKFFEHMRNIRALFHKEPEKTEVKIDIPISMIVRM